jgi:hypothetical protein
MQQPEISKPRDWIDGEIFMDAHSTQVQSDQIETSGRFEPRLPGAIVDQAVAFAGQEVHRLDWSRIREAVMQRRGYPIRITRWDPGSCGTERAVFPPQLGTKLSPLPSQ